MTLRLCAPATSQMTLLFLILFLIMLAGPPLARANAALDLLPPTSPTGQPAIVPAEDPADSREAIVWFGGDDGNCLAYPGGIWDWDNVGAGSMQCWLKTEDAVISVIPMGTWRPWLDATGITGCGLDGNALGFVDMEGSPYTPPGIPPGLWQATGSGVVARTGFEPPYYNTVYLRYDLYGDLDIQRAGTLYRAGYQIFPYQGLPVWSPRMGDPIWYWMSPPTCGHLEVNLSASSSPEPVPLEWDSLRVIYEVWCSCDAWGIQCTAEGDTRGSPLIDNVQIGLAHTADAPPITLAPGHLFQDGFGQTTPDYLSPTDVGNANIGYDLSGDNPARNDWLGDSAVVCGPSVTSQANRWLAEMHFKIERKGPRQDEIPDYAAWKLRLTGDPEQDYVCVLMDSLQASPTQVSRNRFGTYFHESDPGYRGPGDYNPRNEILPDGVFTPGTRIRYYYASYWYNGGAPPLEKCILGPFEFEILPGMEEVSGSPYDVQWPSVLYVDAHNAGSESFIEAALGELGLAHDRYDYDYASTNYNASMKRSFGGGSFNPGGYGNNGCTVEQLLGYRLILLNTATSGPGTLEAADFELLEDWLASTECGLAAVRRGIVFDGDRLGEIMADPALGLAPDFARNTLGVTLVDPSYRQLNGDMNTCIYLEPSTTPAFSPLDPGLSLYGGDCNVLGTQPGVSGVAGNLSYSCYLGGCGQPLVDFAEVVRENIDPGTANWKSVVNGFSLAHLSERACNGLDCPRDSACVVAGIVGLLTPMVDWMTSGAEPFEPWLYPCPGPQGVGEESRLAGPADYLYASRPNPAQQRVDVRFRLGAATHVRIDVYDATGRRIRALVDGDLPAGEHLCSWDATNDRGDPVGAGVFWMQMHTAAGHESAKRMLLLR
jgi:hypothetical protein